MLEKLTFKIGDNTIELTTEDARQLYDELRAFYGDINCPTRGPLFPQYPSDLPNPPSLYPVTC